MTTFNRSCCDDAASCFSSPKNLKIGLIGNPNSGKTTVFNALTGARQRVGNWSGVTVERKTGFFNCQNTTVEVVDLPGTYSLNIVHESASLDERIACEFILSHEADFIVNVLDASNLERNLYLTLQLLEMQVPMLVVVNMTDVAEKRGLHILVDILAKSLGCEVIPLAAHKGQGIKALKEAIIHPHSRRKVHPIFTGMLYQSILEITRVLTLSADAARRTRESVSSKAFNPEWLAIRLLEEDQFAREAVDSTTIQFVHDQQTQLRTTFQEDPDILLADARYRYIQKVMATCVKKATQSRTNWTKRLDNIVLNRVLGIPIFLAVMYAMFFFAINVGGAFQDFFDIGSDTVFVQGGAYLFGHLGFPTWLVTLLADGVGKGINTTITFIPIIGALFLFLAFLEGSGYMARAAFVVDRLMRALGLPGKSFVPMIIGFGCNVPAVMATRTLENKRDRILTVMMSPFMSCGARLAIYAVFTAAFFPLHGQNIVFMLYLIGIIMAMLTGLMLRKTLLSGDPAPLVMELPSYHLPNIRTIFLHAWQRLKGFVFRAGKLIVPICILLGALNAINVDGSSNTGAGSAHSLLSVVGRTLTPLFAPMGIHEDNWPATVGLMTGVLAKEVVVGTLNTIYTEVGNLTVFQADGFNLLGGLHAAVTSIATNFAQLGNSFSNPILAQAPVHALTKGVYGIMYQRFDGPIGAIAYLLFVLLYFPCVSTIAAMFREIHRGWAFFSVFWTTTVAYCTAVAFYQTFTLLQHPTVSICWLMGIGVVMLLIFFGIRVYAQKQEVTGWRRRYELVGN